MSETRLQKIMSSVRSTLSGYWRDIKQIGHDVALPYRHFVHWNISKILIFLYANIGGFVLALPFIIAMVTQYFLVYTDLRKSINLYGFVAEHIWSILLTALLFLCVVTAFIVTYTYGYFLLLRVYRGYTAGEELPYTQNLYFSWEYFRTYMGIVGWMGLYLLLPFLTLLAIAIPFAIAINMGALASITAFVDGNIFIGIVSILVFFGFIGWFIHLALRLTFASFVFLESDATERAKTYIRRAFELTRGKIWKIIFLLAPFFLLIGMVTGVFGSIEHSISLARTHAILSSERARDGKDDHALIQKYVYTDTDVREKFAVVAEQYPTRKDTIDRDFLSDSLEYMDLARIDSKAWMFSTVFVILSYLLLEWIGSMVYFGVYRRIKIQEKIN